MLRREYLQTVVQAVVAPAATTVTSEDEVKVPDAPEDSLFWVVLLGATGHDDPDEAVETLSVTIAPFDSPMSDSPMSAEDVEQHVRAVVRGEYDEEEIQQRARQAWRSG